MGGPTWGRLRVARGGEWDDGNERDIRLVRRPAEPLLDDGEVGGAVVREDMPAFTLWLDDVEIASGQRVAFARVSDGVTALSVDGGAMVPERRASCPPVETP